MLARFVGLVFAALVLSFVLLPTDAGAAIATPTPSAACPQGFVCTTAQNEAAWCTTFCSSRGLDFMGQVNGFEQACGSGKDFCADARGVCTCIVSPPVTSVTPTPRPFIAQADEEDACYA